MFNKIVCSLNRSLSKSFFFQKCIEKIVRSFKNYRHLKSVFHKIVCSGKNYCFFKNSFERFQIVRGLFVNFLKTIIFHFYERFICSSIVNFFHKKISFVLKNFVRSKKLCTSFGMERLPPIAFYHFNTILDITDNVLTLANI